MRAEEEKREREKEEKEKEKMGVIVFHMRSGHFRIYKENCI